MLVLPRQFDPQMDESWALNQLHKAAKCDQLGRVHLDLCESWDQPVG